jgi:hypothetical protein
VSRATLTTDNHPVDPRQLQGGHWPKQRLQRQKPDSRRDAPQLISPPAVLIRLDRRADPDIGQRPEIQPPREPVG